jgi:F420-0:gamma-glutamyl ligase-like protein
MNLVDAVLCLVMLLSVIWGYRRGAILGVMFYTATNGTMLPLNSGSALRILDLAV